MPALKRLAPPSVEDVRACQWWWSYPQDTPPHVLQLDLHGDGDNPDDYNIIMVIGPGPEMVFDPEDWPGEWAPCLPPTE